MKKTELILLIKEEVKKILTESTFRPEHQKLIDDEAKETKPYKYRAKILFGQEVVLKELNGTPIKKFPIYDDLKVANEIAAEMNKNAVKESDYFNGKVEKKYLDKGIDLEYCMDVIEKNGQHKAMDILKKKYKQLSADDIDGLFQMYATTPYPNKLK